MEDRLKRARERQIATAKTYKFLFESANGKIILNDLMKFTDFMGPSQVDGDPYRTAFNDGQKNVIRHIFQKMKVDYEQLEKIITEGADYDRSIWS